MLKRIHTIAAAVILLVSACTVQQVGEAYFPRASQGSQWEYVLRYSTPAGMQLGKVTVRIEGEDTIKGTTYRKEVTTVSGVPDAGTRVSHVRRTLSGIYRTDRNPDWPEYLEIPFPVKEGSAWTAQSSEGLTQYQAERLEDVELNDRKYGKCLKVSFKGPKGAGFSYLAPGTGEVYRVVVSGNVKTDYALDSHSIR